ncbi:hypothetical protein OIU74_020947 [Salix koriyanagi]|uniref:Uncharacterized protein n=1 Tax=Salix koriyanagi TaxID=2511006 RepID=A0A9Q0SMH1_9ROSI|nr:hypothetical protein OIU74_020947 [Salix koriyanagi]
MIVQELAHPSLLINHEIFDVRQLKEGDHIYAWRTRSELYSHHGHSPSPRRFPAPMSSARPAPSRNRNQLVKLSRLQKKSWKLVLARTTSYLTTARTSPLSARRELPSVSKLTAGRGTVDLRYKPNDVLMLPLSNGLISLFTPAC